LKSAIDRVQTIRLHIYLLDLRTNKLIQAKEKRSPFLLSSAFEWCVRMTNPFGGSSAI